MSELCTQCICSASFSLFRAESVGLPAGDVGSPAFSIPTPLTARAAGAASSIEARTAVAAVEHGSASIAAGSVVKNAEDATSQTVDTLAGYSRKKMALLVVKPIRVAMDFLLLFLGKYFFPNLQCCRLANAHSEHISCGVKNGHPRPLSP